MTTILLPSIYYSFCFFCIKVVLGRNRYQTFQLQLWLQLLVALGRAFCYSKEVLPWIIYMYKCFIHYFMTIFRNLLIILHRVLKFNNTAKCHLHYRLVGAVILHSHRASWLLWTAEYSKSVLAQCETINHHTIIE